MSNAGTNILTGASTGAAAGSAAGPIGTAIGAVGGAIVGGLASIKPAKAGYKKFVKQQFKELMAKGTTLSDEERRQMGAEMVSAQAQAQAAQDISQARRSIAQTGGGPITKGADTKTARDLGEATRSGAIVATSAANKRAAALDERRKSIIMQRMAKIADMEGAEAAQNRDTALALGDALAQMGAMT